jgi:hypothetical protein
MRCHNCGLTFQRDEPMSDSFPYREHLAHIPTTRAPSKWETYCDRIVAANERREGIYGVRKGR